MSVQNRGLTGTDFHAVHVRVQHKQIVIARSRLFYIIDGGPSASYGQILCACFAVRVGFQDDRLSADIRCGGDAFAVGIYCELSVRNSLVVPVVDLGKNKARALPLVYYRLIIVCPSHFAFPERDREHGIVHAVYALLGIAERGLFNIEGMALLVSGERNIFRHGISVSVRDKHRVVSACVLCGDGTPVILINGKHDAFEPVSRAVFLDEGSFAVFMRYDVSYLFSRIGRDGLSGA